jgi:hypothetical protein
MQHNRISIQIFPRENTVYGGSEGEQKSLDSDRSSRRILKIV